MADLFRLSDEHWAVIEPFMSKNQPGPERKEDRQIIFGILHVLTCGCRWRDCPAAYRPRTTVYNRFNRWSRRGFWKAMLAAPANRLAGPGFLAKRVYDLPGALTYSTKDTRLGYITVENRRFQPDSAQWRRWFQHREALSGPKLRLLLGALGDLTKPQLCVSSGAGRGVLREAKRLAQAQGYKRLPVGPRRAALRRRSRPR
jgi:transposase